MSLEFPENMRELEDKFAIKKARDPKVTKQQVMRQTIEETFQAYLDYAEDGHYDTGKLVGNELQVLNLNNKVVKKVKPLTDSFENDFETNADRLLGYLEDEATRAARM
ncbi:hypothetical protein HMPREF9103_01343 [Lentilactobacillus parafarraginis F0439]|uniref:Uncharacterized protein n=1 Tax=Lentilactobacillus parafarraginis F0439 TaxID=797515 RepID=G9ZNP0_9LACO|nr:hypothetical protein [Lentilactobacillus parafarraginis]EHL98788.1 hypothetical protein HMPREF9103_01343 [Lentilactobacillus parafarraginis F0439]